MKKLVAILVMAGMLAATSAMAGTKKKKTDVKKPFATVELMKAKKKNKPAGLN